MPIARRGRARVRPEGAAGGGPGAGDGGALRPMSGSYQEAGRVHADSPALAALVPPGARVEKLADGFTWAEGPVWIRDGGYLLFSDVPANRMYRWSQADGASVFLEPSGYD